MQICFYNATCTALCGNCANQQLCDKRTGACLNGCRQHFKRPLCQGNFLLILQRLREFNGRGHFKTVLISFRRGALYTNIEITQI